MSKFSTQKITQGRKIDEDRIKFKLITNFKFIFYFKYNELLHKYLIKIKIFGNIVTLFPVYSCDVLTTLR